MSNLASKLAKILQSRDFWIRMFFIGLAASFWLLIKLSKTGYVHTVEYPVAYINIPKNKIMVQPDGASIAVRVNTVGFRLFGIGGKKNEPLEIDVKRFSRSIQKGSSTYYWLPNLYRDEIEANLETQAQLLRIDPDTLFFTMIDKVTKTIPVKLQAQVVYANGFAPYTAPSLNPTYVSVTGPQDVLDTMQVVRTEPVSFKKLDESVSQELKLKAAHPQVEIAPNVTQLTIDVAQYTEKKLLVPVSVLNPPRGEQVKIHPSKVEVTVRVALRDYNAITEEKITVTCNVAQLRQHPERMRLMLDISSESDLAKIIGASTFSVDYLRFKL